MYVARVEPSEASSNSPADTRRRSPGPLSGGFWGLSRHINYLGEILMAIGLTLSLGFGPSWAWLYPLYYLALLIPRQADDERRCAQKYGAGWDEYRRLVKWRIVPGIY